MKKNIFLTIVISASLPHAVIAMDNNNNNDIIEQNNLIKPEQSSYIQQYFLAPVTNIFNSATNKVAKNIGYKDVTSESKEEFERNILELGKIVDGEKFINDWKNHNAFSNQPSFLNKAIEREYAYQRKAIATIYLMHDTDSFDVKQLNEIENSMVKTEKYQQSLNAIFKAQYLILKDKLQNSIPKDNPKNDD